MGRKKAQTSNSATVTTLDDNKGTETQLIPDDARAEELKPCNGVYNNCESEPLQTTNGMPSQYETTVFHFNRSNVDSEEETALCDTDIGVSSFLPHPLLRRCNGHQQNAESAYSSFEEDQSDCGNYSVINDDGVISKDNKPECNGVISTNGDLKHNTAYGTVIYPGEENNKPKPHMPEYAVISRVARQRNDFRNLNDKGLFTNRPVHVVPEDNNSEASQSPASSTMHLIPEHKCLLHNIPPPPPPPTTKISDVESNHSRGSWSTIHAQV